MASKGAQELFEEKKASSTTVDIDNVAWRVVLQIPTKYIRKIKSAEMTEEIKTLQANGAAIGRYENKRINTGQLFWGRESKDADQRTPLTPYVEVFEWRPTVTWVRPICIQPFEGGYAAIVHVLDKEGVQVNWGAGPTLPQRYIMLRDAQYGKSGVLTVSIEHKLRLKLGLEEARFGLFEEEATIPEEMLKGTFLSDCIKTANVYNQKYTRPWGYASSHNSLKTLFLTCCSVEVPRIASVCSKCGKSLEGALRVCAPFQDNV